MKKAAFSTEPPSHQHLVEAMVTMDQSQALALAEKHLEEEAVYGLIHCRSVFVESGDPLSPHIDRDLWVIYFERPPTGTDLDDVHPNTVVVVIDCVSGDVWSRSLL